MKISNVINKFFKKKIDYISILENFSYRPNAAFKVKNQQGQDFIVLEFPVVCANTGELFNDKGERLHIFSRKELYSFNLYDEEKFKRDVLMLCYQAEMHEAMEFLKYKGKKIFDPHNGHYSSYEMNITFTGK